MERAPRTPQPIESREKLDFDLKNCLTKANGVIDSHRLPLESFADLYGKDATASDLHKLMILKGGFEDGGVEKDISTCFEAFIVDQINHGLFGEFSKSLPTSEYDDVHNGIDSITEIARLTQPTQHLGLALDATYSLNHLEQKLRGIQNRISMGRLAQVKYFKSERTGFRGEYKVPLFVVGLSRENILPLLKAWSHGDAETLSKSPHALVLLKQIEAQAQKFEEFSHTKKHDTLAARYRDTLSLVSEIRPEKRRELGIAVLPDNWQRDRVSTEILKITNAIKA